MHERAFPLTAVPNFVRFMRKGYDADAIYRAFEATLGYVHYCSVEQTDMEAAIKARWKDYEDCLICVCAKKAEADALITRDRTGFAQSSVPAMDAESFFAMIAREYGMTYDEAAF